MASYLVSTYLVMDTTIYVEEENRYEKEHSWNTVDHRTHDPLPWGKRRLRPWGGKKRSRECLLEPRLLLTLKKRP
jgi:hypothetical protein